MLAFDSRLTCCIIALLSLAACNSEVVPQINGLNATINGEFAANLTSGDLLYTFVKGSTEKLILDTDSFDYDTNQEFLITFAFEGPITPGDYPASEPGVAAEQTVSVELDVRDFDGNIVSSWKSKARGTANLTEVTETRIVGSFDIPLLAGDREIDFSGSLYLLPLPSEVNL